MPTTSKLTLYSNPRTRGQIVEWYLNELRAPFETRVVDLATKEHKSEWFMAINPFGKLPALQDGDITLFESGAVLLYLAETLGGADTPAKRAELAKWILFANSTMPLEDVLSKQPYLTGDTLSAADIAVGANLLYLPMFAKDFDLSAYPAVDAYCKRLQEREACPIKPVPAA